MLICSFVVSHYIHLLITSQCDGCNFKMESLNNGFAPLAYHGRAMGYACDEPPRLYAQDPDFVDDFAHVNDEPDKIAQYDYSFAIVGEGSGKSLLRFLILSMRLSLTIMVARN